MRIHRYCHYAVAQILVFITKDGLQISVFFRPLIDDWELEKIKIYSQTRTYGITLIANPMIIGVDQAIWGDTSRMT